MYVHVSLKACSTPMSTSVSLNCLVSQSLINFTWHIEFAEIAKANGKACCQFLNFSTLKYTPLERDRLVTSLGRVEVGVGVAGPLALSSFGGWPSIFFEETTGCSHSKARSMQYRRLSAVSCLRAYGSRTHSMSCLRFDSEPLITKRFKHFGFDAALAPVKSNINQRKQKEQQTIEQIRKRVEAKKQLKEAQKEELEGKKVRLFCYC